jgi:hypothetical protein
MSMLRIAITIITPSDTSISGAARLARRSAVAEVPVHQVTDRNRDYDGADDGQYCKRGERCQQLPRCRVDPNANHAGRGMGVLRDQAALPAVAAAGSCRPCGVRAARRCDDFAQHPAISQI